MENPACGHGSGTSRSLGRRKKDKKGKRGEKSRKQNEGLRGKYAEEVLYILNVFFSIKVILE